MRRLFGDLRVGRNRLVLSGGVQYSPPPLPPAGPRYRFGRVEGVLEFSAVP